MSPQTIELLERGSRVVETAEAMRRELARTLAAVQAARAERERALRDPFACWPRQGPRLAPRGPAWPERSR